MFVSDFLTLNDKQFKSFVSKGVFDALIDKDSPFYINVIRLKDTVIPEFVGAYANLNKFFNELATLLDAANTPNLKEDKMYRSARKKCDFHEVNGINLGLSNSSYGAGWGKVLTDRFLKDAYQIVKKGCKQPEIFQLVSLFEEGVAGDRVSDMIASIIEPDIKKYTLRIMEELGISKENYPKLKFGSDGLIQNPYKSAPILLLPISILHEMPVAKDWDDIDRVVAENDVIRSEISSEIAAEWTRWESSEKKRYLFNNIFMIPEKCEKVIDGYKKEELNILNLKENPEYFAQVLLKMNLNSVDFKTQQKFPSSFEAALAVINIFKDWVENNRGWAEIQEAPSKTREKAVQRYMHLGAKHYVAVNDIDISCVSNEAKWPVDIKLSRGNDKTLAEIKLSTNNQYLHGYKYQVQEYGKAEHTRKLIYVFVDIGNSGRLRTLKKIHQVNVSKGIACPELVIIDARKQKSASKVDCDIKEFEQKGIYKDIDFDFGDFPRFDLEDLDNWKFLEF